VNQQASGFAALALPLHNRIVGASRRHVALREEVLHTTEGENNEDARAHEWFFDDGILYTFL